MTLDAVFEVTIHIYIDTHSQHERFLKGNFD